ncbi:MAG: hypothetical protein VB082_07055 [Christensenella sp.]|nr:hypothetical protein [Christensenella sp.]
MSVMLRGAPTGKVRQARSERVLQGNVIAAREVSEESATKRLEVETHS